jgi:hypothetical protein
LKSFVQDAGFGLFAVDVYVHAVVVVTVVAVREEGYTENRIRR